MRCGLRGTGWVISRVVGPAASLAGSGVAALPLRRLGTLTTVARPDCVLGRGRSEDRLALLPIPTARRILMTLANPAGFLLVVFTFRSSAGVCD